MKDDVVQAATLLADVLSDENQALQRLDYSAAVALVPAKEAMMATLGKAVAHLHPVEHTPALTALGQRLRFLAAENQVLLERAIEVQTRIVRIVARAAMPSAESGRYTVDGGREQPSRVMALALSTRA